MDNPILEILGILEATPADYVMFFLGVGVVCWEIGYRAVTGARNKRLAARVLELEKKYNLLNTSTVRLWDRVDPDMVNDHHSGDFSIKLRRDGLTNPRQDID